MLLHNSGCGGSGGRCCDQKSGHGGGGGRMKDAVAREGGSDGGIRIYQPSTEASR